MTDQRETLSPTHPDGAFARELESMLEGQAEVTNERDETRQREERSQIGERSEREERRIDDSEMERDMRQHRMWMERQDRHQYIIGDEIEPVNPDNFSRERRLQAGGGRPRQGERGMWQEGRETRFQEMAHDQNPASRRREENRRLGSMNFSSLESSQGVERGKSGRERGKKTLFKRQETGEERRKRLVRNRRARLHYREVLDRDTEIMNGNDPIKKEEVQQKRIEKKRKRKKKYQQRKKLERKIAEKQQEPEIMEEDDLLVRTTVRSKQFRKDGTNSCFQQTTEGRRKAQTLVGEEEDNDEDGDESEGEWRRYYDGEEDDE